MIIKLCLMVFGVFSIICANEQTEKIVQDLTTTMIEKSTVLDSIPIEFQIELNVAVIKQKENNRYVGKNIGSFFYNRLRINGNDFIVDKVITGFIENKFSCVVLTNAGIFFIMPYIELKKDLNPEETPLNTITNVMLNNLKWIVISSDGTELYIY